MRIIDSHVYLGQGKHLNLDADSLLKLMDEADIEWAIACPVDHCLEYYLRDYAKNYIIPYQTRIR